MLPTTSPSKANINRNCVLRRNVDTQPYGRCSVCTLQLKDCHAWQSQGFSFALIVLLLTLVLVPAGWPQQLVAAAALVVLVWQGLTIHRRTDELIHGAHRLMALTQELQGKQLVIEHHNATLAAQVQARTRELHESNLRLAAANLELLELDKLRTSVVSNVSHELRTPLTGILGSAQNLRDGLAGDLTREQREYVWLIEQESGRLARVVNELLEWGRLQAGQIELRRRAVQLQSLVDEVFMLLRPAAQARGVALQAEALDGVPQVDADPDKLKQVLINLVDNAIKFSPREASVRVRAELADGRPQLLVQDDGPGIAPADRPHLFERFYRGGGADTAPGTGLGLAIARNIARLHGGDVTLRETSGGGSCFALTLPAGAAG